MSKKFASCLKQLQGMSVTSNYILTFKIAISFMGAAFVAQAQPLEIKKEAKPGVLSVAYFVESANNSVNSLTSLLKKDNYRNKITALNNPVNNELGFSLKAEILTALKPILDKAKKTDGGKFRDVIENFLNHPEDNGIKSVKKFMPSLGIFSTVLSLVGNLVIVEKSVTKEDLDKFINKVQQYFYQYERLNAINEHFAEQVDKMLEKSEDTKDDIREFLVECITTLNKSISRTSIRDLSVEILLQKYYDPQKIQVWIDTCQQQPTGFLYPPDAATSVKMIATNIKRIQKEFEAIYTENYASMKELMNSLEKTIPNLDKAKLSRTGAEIDQLYNESKQADMINLNMAQVNERMNMVCAIINAGNR